MEKGEPFDYQQLADLLSRSHFSVCRTATDELIYTTWCAQFRVSSRSEELSGWIPEKPGDYFYWPIMGTSAKPEKSSGEEAWQSHESASPVGSLTLTQETTEEILPKHIFLSDQGRQVFVSCDLVKVFSSSGEALQQYYRFEQLEGELIRVLFSQESTTWQAIAILML